MGKVVFNSRLPRLAPKGSLRRHRPEGSVGGGNLGRRALGGQACRRGRPADTTTFPEMLFRQG